MQNDSARRFLRALMALLVLLVAVPSPVWADEPAKGAQGAPQRVFRWEGEELFYSVEVSGTDAARAAIRVGKRQKAKAGAYIPVAADAVTHGFFAKSYPANNHADTFIDPVTFQPLQSDKVIAENGDKKTYKVKYNPGGFTARVDKNIQEKGKKADAQKFERPVPDSIHDALSWLFDLRARPLKDGDVYTYYIYDGWKLSRLTVKVVRREKAWTPLKEYAAIRVDVEREILHSRWTGTSQKRGAPTFTQAEKPYYFSTLHLSDDANRTPVKIFLTSQKADAELRLVDHKPPK